MVALLVFAWVKLHALPLPHAWKWTLVYAAVCATICKLVHYVAHHYVIINGQHMEPIHIEVLLPAFVIGCVVDTPCARAELALQRASTLARLESKISVANSKHSQISVDTDSKIIVTSEHSKISVDTDRTHVAKVSSGVPLAWVDDEVKGMGVDIKLIGRGKLSEGSTGSPLAKIPCENCSSEGRSEVGVTVNEKERPTLPGTVHDDENGPIKMPRQTSQDSAIPIRSQSGSKMSLTSQSTLTSRLSRYGTKAELGDESHEEDATEHAAQTAVSMIFMVLVGLSMPPLIREDTGNEDEGSNVDAAFVIFHVAMVSLLMVVGKMFPVFCYRDEVPLSSRLALCLGMCPRGEVGASIIVISLELGVTGPAVTVAMLALVINLVMSGGFIGSVKLLLGKQQEHDMLH